MNQDQTSGEAGRGLGAAPFSAVESSKPKIDWFTPLIPAMCLISAITTMKSHADSVTEAIANHILGILLVYAAILNLVNALRRNPPNDKISHERT